MSLRNPYRAFLDLMPKRPLQVGTVSAVAGGVATGHVLPARVIQIQTA